MNIFKKKNANLELDNIEDRLKSLERDKFLGHYKDDSEYGWVIHKTREDIADLKDKAEFLKPLYLHFILNDILNLIKNDRKDIKELKEVFEKKSKPVENKETHKCFTQIFQRLAKLEKANVKREETVDPLLDYYEKVLENLLEGAGYKKTSMTASEAVKAGKK